MKPDRQFLRATRVRVGKAASDDSDGCNGVFRWTEGPLAILAIASDREGWGHVSITAWRSVGPEVGAYELPSWDLMERVKQLFFGPDAWVIQYHPPKAKRINNHNSCLHLWEPLKQKLPIPPPEMV